MCAIKERVRPIWSMQKEFSIVDLEREMSDQSQNDSNFGSWMLVQPRNRRKQTNEPSKQSDVGNELNTQNR